jgi:hypothetical protein
VIAQTRFISCGFPGGVLSISCLDSYASLLPKGSGPVDNNHGVASVSGWRQDAPEVRVQICALIASQEKAIRRPLSVRQRWTPFSDFFGLNLTVPPTDAGRSLSKSAASRHFVALSGARWCRADRAPRLREGRSCRPQQRQQPQRDELEDDADLGWRGRNCGAARSGAAVSSRS